ncbi:MAG TPA: sugar transferase [Candidatus Ozemobacteraceae bacterium]|mgnify:CR=1 FL=1|nr:sugar transferase [Candidatus Ozemobacteraceae bacterium]
MIRRGRTAKLAKRLLDFAAAWALTLLIWPLMLATTVLIRTMLGSPVLFRQTRPGLKGRLFEMLKFRSMKDALDEHGRPLPDEQRMTWLGTLLRRLSIDELPQLFNVLRGEMSLVGPRPLLVEYLPLYSAEQMRRHEMPPGITGWAQINGRNAVSWEERFRMDVWYVDHWSLLLDLKILVATVSRVWNRSGVSQPGHVTMEPFRGNKKA